MTKQRHSSGVGWALAIVTVAAFFLIALAGTTVAACVGWIEYSCAKSSIGLGLGILLTVVGAAYALADLMKGPTGE